MIDESLFELPDTERIRIYRTLIEPFLFDEATTSAQPVAILIGGQPGAGKTRATEDVLLEYADAKPLALGVDHLVPREPRPPPPIRAEGEQRNAGLGMCRSVHLGSASLLTPRHGLTLP